MENRSEPSASLDLTAREGAYRDQTERDYAAFSAAVDSGRLVAQTGL